MAEKKEKTWIKLKSIRHPLSRPANLRSLVENYLRDDKLKIENIKILRRSIDARQERIDIVYTLGVELVAERKSLDVLLSRKDVERYTPFEIKISQKIKRLKKQPVIIGCGPAGLFAALVLTERGSPPILIERGPRMPQRVHDVDRFWKSGHLNSESNVFFGEGGAGTFSDGKLTTRIKNPLKEKVLRELVKYGAPDEILFSNKPHLGTDQIRKIITLFVESLKKKGVEFKFNTRVTDIKADRGTIRGVNAAEKFIETDTLFLATGHSARDIYYVLNRQGVALEPKGFAAGLRIEHPQELVNRWQWGKWAGTPGLGPADYYLTFRDGKTGRGVYTFCMCPGGYVIGCSTIKGELSTNGMSDYQRSSPWANAAVVVTVGPEDFKSDNPLAGLEFQRQLERRAFSMGGGNFYAPAQTAKDLVEGCRKRFQKLSCSFQPGVKPVDLEALLPEFLREPLKRALLNFDKRLPGFIGEGMLIGVETKTSSSIRIKRDPDTFHALNVNGLIPIGEGSGYAGGIISCAVDGIRAALNFDSR